MMKINQKFCFVAKANCYGLGVKLCSYFNNDVDYFAVSSYYEFVKIKKYVTKPILILDPVFNKKQLIYLINNDAELTVSNLDNLRLLINLSNMLNKKIKIHIAINTGMNRLGFKENKDLVDLTNLVEKTQNIKIKGIFSHYFQANNKKNDKTQINLLKNAVNIIETQLNISPLIHICSSDGVINYNYGDMVRVGYGIYSDKIYETITLKSKIIDIQNLVKNEIAGYNGVFVSNTKTKIAVVSIGYGDGLFRNIASKGYVLINDNFAKIVASCMDTIIVDISNVDCKINDDVIIIGKCQNNKISICDIARFCDTIGYEVIVRLSSRIKRKYVLK